MKQQELIINTDGIRQFKCTCPHCKYDNSVAIDVENKYTCDNKLNLHVMPIFYMTCALCNTTVLLEPDI